MSITKFIQETLGNTLNELKKDVTEDRKSIDLPKSSRQLRQKEAGKDEGNERVLHFEELYVKNEKF